MTTESTARKKTRPHLSMDELEALGTSTDVATAGRAFGMSRDTSYDLARSGEFPRRVIKIGTRYVVPVADLRRALGMTA